MTFLTDRFSRQFNCLRISVTDRCDFRCTYCMPAEGIATVAKADILSFEEIARVVRVGVSLGLTRVRLTGGEPTVRADLPVLVRMLRSIDGLADLSMTTNGARLPELATPLRDAGLDRLNISLDSLDRDTAARLARRDVLPRVLAGIDAAISSGFSPIKLNAVVIRDVNDRELVDLVRHAAERGMQMRFIEYMPMGDARLDAVNQTVTSAEMKRRLSAEFDLMPDSDCGEHDPARGYVCRRTGARVGFISSISESFCASCNRMRLTAEGALRPCLHQDAEAPLRHLLRNGGTDDQIGAVFRHAAELKWEGHRMTKFVPLFSRREMVGIGG